MCLNFCGSLRLVAGRWRRCCVWSRACVALLLGGSALAAWGRETVEWGALDFPPFQIREGEFRGSGSFDGLLDLLIRFMPEYDHEVVTMSFARREEAIRQGEKLCTPGLFRTPEREKNLVFSMPALIHLDNRVVYLAARAASFPGRRDLDLEDLFKRGDLVGGLISNRSFAPNIDPLLQRYAKAPNLLQRPLRSAQMFELLLNGEIDYTILFPHEAAYLVRQHPRKPAVVARPIAGTPRYIFTHVACTKGPWGEAMIARINQILQAQRKQPAYRALSERWYDEPDKLLIRNYYKQMLAPDGGHPWASGDR